VRQVVIKCCRLCKRQCHDITICGDIISILYSLSEARSDSDTKQQRGGSDGGRSSKLNMGSGRLKKKKVVVHSSVVAMDINPLKPCGACNGWLKRRTILCMLQSPLNLVDCRAQSEF